jgi:hypothetical protein
MMRFKVEPALTFLLIPARKTTGPILLSTQRMVKGRKYKEAMVHREKPPAALSCGGRRYYSGAARRRAVSPSS